jgi:glucokinase
MLLAGDIGGTKTLIGLFDPLPARPRAIAVRAFTTIAFPHLPAIISRFVEEEGMNGAAVQRACFGVAGPVVGQTAELSNVPWRVDAQSVADAFHITRVVLLNDLQAMAYGVPVLQANEVHTLQEGEALRGGNIALIAAGTGLGQALLHNVNGRFIPSPSEGGHADFAPRNEREIDLLRDLIQRFGRGTVEHVVSGRGLINIHRVTHTSPCLADRDADGVVHPSAISAAALDGRCRGCVDALQVFVECYGAEAGNVALRTVATGGVFVGGGIAPKILPALTDGRFMRAFTDKAPLDAITRTIPVKVILNPEVGLLGAAMYAAEM